MWLRDGRCEEVVKANWACDQEGSMDRLRHNVEKMGSCLSQWGRTTFGHVQQLLHSKLNENPKRMSQFRPISLCNVVYKIVSKLLANRIRKILPEIISINQSAFVAGRLISDNVLASFEIFHFLKNKRHGKEGHFALKLDMSKAYNRVEWRFVRGVMERMGFNQYFVDTILYCISSVSYSVLVNGHPTKTFVPKRGLRQGDPLSPYLFVLCAEGLSSLIKRAEREGKLTGVAVCRGSPRVSHIFFADDSLLFGAANPRELSMVKDILGKYEIASGQKINLEKSAICFSKNVGMDTQVGLRNAMGVGNLVDSGKYLGLPYIVGRSKRGIFNYVKDRVWKWLNGWKEKYLSAAGREILIKSVAQSIPTYIMSCFQLPDMICEEIDSMVRNYWWGERESKRKNHWKNWRALCDPKWLGGMGFRSLKAFNKALLAKQGWRLISAPDSLLARILKAKYYPHTSFLQAGVGSNPSFTWRSIFNARPLLEARLRWRVGDGRSIQIWGDKWVPQPHSFRVCSPTTTQLQGALVSDLINVERHCWDVTVLHENFLAMDVEAIQQIPLCCHGIPDMLVWHYTRNGLFSVRSAYHLQMNLSVREVRGSGSDVQHVTWFWKRVWSLRIPNKIKVFAWKCCSNILSVKSVLRHRHILIEDMCDGCGAEAEMAYGVGRRTNKVTLGLFLVVCWGLWSSRNQALFMDHGNEKWRPSVGAILKVNFDGAMFMRQKACGVEVMIRDHKGVPIAALSEKIPTWMEVDCIEATAVVKALDFAAELGLTNIQLEGDSLTVVEAIREDGHLSASFGHFLQYAIYRSKHFSSFCVSHMRWSGNVVAHHLAQMAKEDPDKRVWMAGVPEHLC
ncbi:uncharacterized protein LOC114266180 [Camellia sinensis]|uniref:uncharacterized protein LOC114266180 n=1 Tax=Camellia sinensis TaxID=4442 RepID=UPI001036D7D6|nr:uncharacterized protein LOC114266180 [Camellia sinensis]